MQMWCRFSSSTVGKSLHNKVYCACLFSATELNTPTEVTPCGIGIARSHSTDFENCLNMPTISSPVFLFFT